MPFCVSEFRKRDQNENHLNVYVCRFGLFLPQTIKQFVILIQRIIVHHNLLTNISNKKVIIRESNRSLQSYLVIYS